MSLISMFSSFHYYLLKQRILFTESRLFKGGKISIRNENVFQKDWSIKKPKNKMFINNVLITYGP